MKKWIQVFFVLLSVFTAIETSAQQSPKPNFIIVFIDDLGYGDLGCFGSKINPTPHIDKLASGGGKMTMNYITNPPCCPSRSSLITGMYAQRFGKFGMSRGLPLPDNHPTLAEFLLEEGYETGHLGKWDIGATGQTADKVGFTQVARYVPGEGKATYLCKKEDGTLIYRTDLDAEYLESFIDRNHDKPFFLYYSPWAVHSSLDSVPQHYIDRIKTGRTAERNYGGAVAAVDDAFGRVMAKLKEHNLQDNTFIIFTSDNGPQGGKSDPYRGGKGGGTQYNGWVQTPAIVYWPGVIPAGENFDGIMCTLDYYATIAGILGKPLPEGCDGKNLMPYLTGQKDGDVHEFLFWHNSDPRDAERRRLYAIRWQKWRMRKDIEQDRWLLFDLAKDPKETTDISDDHVEVMSTMLKEYDDFVVTLPDVYEFEYSDRNKAKQPVGHGWIIGDGGTR